ncbi:hypothetical protein [Salinibius halmophilus]|uniref:hypothetical protein n=1 Tax=Salinibius halmophilus TaxID=1853216 RepID=UPI000E66D0D3|nr:hypothetical protein [Salinibius halmophilus]
MTWMQYTIELIDILVWPAVLVFSLVSLRAPLARLIPLAKRLKYKELEVEFGQGLAVVKQKAEGAFPELKQDRKAQLIATAKHLPNAAVLGAWKEVNDAAELLIRQRQPNVDLNIDRRYKLLEDILASESMIDTKKVKLFSELRQLRNKVAHAVDYEVASTEAVEYIELCFTLIAHLKNIESKK